MRRISLKLKLFVAAAVVAAAAALPAVAGARATDTAPLQFFSDDSAVGSGAHTTLQRAADGVTLHVSGRKLGAGDAYTFWFVVFNDPENCSAPGCGGDDIFLPDGNLNFAQIAAADISVMWSGAGGVANRAGNLNASGGAGVGAAGAPGEVLFGNALVDHMGAEIHIVVRWHGPSTGNPAETTTFDGSCVTDNVDDGLPCDDVQFSVHPAA